jgi:hypothetical protein
MAQPILGHSRQFYDEMRQTERLQDYKEAPSGRGGTGVDRAVNYYAFRRHISHGIHTCETPSSFLWLSRPQDFAYSDLLP